MLRAGVQRFHGDDMTAVCSCDEPGFCERRKCLIPGIHFKRCQSGQVELLDELYRNKLAPVSPVKQSDLVLPTGGQSVSERRAAISTFGTRLQTEFERSFGVAIKCGSCKTFLRSLNNEAHHDVAVVTERLLHDLPIPYEKRIELGDLKSQREWLRKIVQQVSETPRPQPRPPRQRRDRLHAGYSAIIKKVSASLAAQQNLLHLKTQQAPKPNPDPFIKEPVLHFGAHLWPTPGNWQWHVNLWNMMPPLINGRCFIGIATGPGTDTAAAVRAVLNPAFEVYEFANTKEGENITFRWLQGVVPQGQDDVLIYCHGKGAKPNTSKSDAVRRWTEAMYQTVVFNHDMIREKMSAGYKIINSFRVYGSKFLSPKYEWHPSGTFFAVRAKYLAGRIVKARYGGVEGWPGNHFEAREAWCEFYDNCMFTTMYDHEACKAIVEPMVIEWNRVQRYER